MPLDDHTPIDPTANVLNLVTASVAHLNDLRVQDKEHVLAMAALRSAHDDKLREKESHRIDAIRAVDVAAVQRAAEVSALQASTLQTQVAATAEALRVQVSEAANATAAALTQALDPIIKNMEVLRQLQFEQQGQKAEQSDQRMVRNDGRENNQWIIGTVLVVVIFLSQLLVHFLPA